VRDEPASVLVRWMFVGVSRASTAPWIRAPDVYFKDVASNGREAAARECRLQLIGNTLVINATSASFPVPYPLCCRLRRSMKSSLEEPSRRTPEIRADIAWDHVRRLSARSLFADYDYKECSYDASCA
jgi:hypothetical protein